MLKRKRYGFLPFHWIYYLIKGFYTKKKSGTMNIGDRIKQLRTEKKWTQAELSEKIGVKQKQISAYERGTNIPSAEILIRISEAFDVSLDYLASEARGQSAKIEVKDRELLRYFEAIDDYNEDERTLVKNMLNLVVMKHKFQNIALAQPHSIL